MNAPGGMILFKKFLLLLLYSNLIECSYISRVNNTTYLKWYYYAERERMIYLNN